MLGIIIIVSMWLISGAIAYTHRVYDDGKNYGILHPTFIRDSFFYDSLFSGFVAFYFEFLGRPKK